MAEINALISNGRPQIDDAPAGECSIGEMATRYGVSYRTLRFYEQRGFLRPVRRDGQRVYSAKDRIRLEIVLVAKRLGFSLAEVSTLIQSRSDAEDAPPSVASLSLSKEQIGARVEHLVSERANVQRAIEELREAASRIDRAPSSTEARRSV